MKSKLLKLRNMKMIDWVCVPIYIALLSAAIYNAIAHDIRMTGVILCYFALFLSWNKERSKKEQLEDATEMLTKQYEESQVLVRGLIAQNNELKEKLKNTKMQLSRIKKNGGKKDE